MVVRKKWEERTVTDKRPIDNGAAIGVFTVAAIATDAAASAVEQAIELPFLDDHALQHQRVKRVGGLRQIVKFMTGHKLHGRVPPTRFPSNLGSDVLWGGVRVLRLSATPRSLESLGRIGLLQEWLNHMSALSVLARGQGGRGRVFRHCGTCRSDSDRLMGEECLAPAWKTGQ